MLRSRCCGRYVGGLTRNACNPHGASKPKLDVSPRGNVKQHMHSDRFYTLQYSNSHEYLWAVVAGLDAEAYKSSIEGRVKLNQLRQQMHLDFGVKVGMCSVLDIKYTMSETGLPIG
ncbi:hypothetical protein GQ457_07G026760 [Hibiscus cannabinus]